MPNLTTKNKKYLRYAVTTLLLTGVISVTGFLSFAGMLALSAPIYLAITAFFLAGGIEGEIYAQYINKSLLKLFSNNYLEDQIYSALLDKLLEEHPDNLFLKDYHELLERIEDLEHRQNPANDDEVQKKLKTELENAKRSLKWIKHDFAKFMKGETNPYNYIFHEELSELVSLEQKQATAKEITKKRFWGRLSWILNLGAGVSCFLVGLEAAQTSLAALITHFGIAISGAALSASIFGIAIVGAIGYTLLIHHTVSQMIQDETVQNWVRKIKDFFTQKPHNFKEGIKYAAIALGIVTVITLSILATLATAGTWWYAAKAGAKMIPWLAGSASEIRTGAVVTMSITSLAFNLTRSLDSIKALVQRLKQLPKEIRKAAQDVKQLLDKYNKLENKTQFYNPFRFVINIIAIPFKTLTFIGHLLSMAVMGDRIAGVPAALATGVNLSNEFIVDQDILFPHKHHHEKSPCPAKSTAAKGHKAEKKENHSKEHEHDHKHHHEHEHHHAHKHKHQHKAHDHSHIDLVGKFLNYFALSPLHLLEALWDYGFSRKNTGEKQALTFKKALKKAFFGLPPASKPLPELKLSLAAQLCEKQNRLERAKTKSSKNYRKEQGDIVIKELQEQILPATEAPRAAYVNRDGTINPTAFFAGKTLGNSTRKVCDKFIEIANGRQYGMAAPGA